MRLHSQPSWQQFIDDLRDIFPNLEIRVEFDVETSEFIDVSIRTDQEWVPLEIAGTGVLQATQILSYIHRFLRQQLLSSIDRTHVFTLITNVCFALY